jgi:hypothetical protein
MLLLGDRWRQGQAGAIFGAPQLCRHEQDLVAEGLQRALCKSGGKQSRLNQLTRL